MKKLALIGYGKWGRNYLRAARESGLARVTQVVIRPESPAWSEHLPAEVRRVPSFEDLECPDGVIVATHPRLASAFAVRALGAGVPVLVEKPAGLSLEDAERIARWEAVSRAVVLIGHQHLFAGAYEALRERAALMSFPLEVTSTGANHGPFRDYSPLWDYGPHDVSMLLGLGLGAISHVTCHKRDAGAGGERFHLAVDLERGRASIILSNGSPARTRFFDARHGRWFVSYDDRLEGPRLSSSDGLIGFESGPPLTRAVRAFAQAIEDGGTDDYRFGARWAVDVARVLDAAERACLVGGVDF